MSGFEFARARYGTGVSVELAPRGDGAFGAAFGVLGVAAFGAVGAVAFGDGVGSLRAPASGFADTLVVLFAVGALGDG
jgi:hypothetical protein